MEKTDANNTMNKKQGIKSYNPIELTIYGKMVELTAAGSAKLGSANEGANGANATKRV